MHWTSWVKSQMNYGVLPSSMICTCFLLTVVSSYTFHVLSAKYWYFRYKLQQFGPKLLNRHAVPIHWQFDSDEMAVSLLISVIYAQSWYFECLHVWNNLNVWCLQNLWHQCFVRGDSKGTWVVDRVTIIVCSYNYVLWTLGFMIYHLSTYEEHQSSSFRLHLFTISLCYRSLGTNNFSGPLPSELGNLTKLTQM